MRALSFMVAVACVLLLVFAGSCTSLALNGKAKYKVDLNNAFAKIKDEINTDGAPSEKSVTKLEDLLEKYRAEYSSKGSFTESEEALKALKESQSDPAQQFQKLQVALTHAAVAQDYLKTETDN